MASLLVVCGIAIPVEATAATVATPPDSAICFTVGPFVLPNSVVIGPYQVCFPRP
jgi:hypothetical protein